MSPRPELIACIILCTIPILFGQVMPAALPIGVLIMLVVVLISILDLLLSGSPSKIEVERDAGEIISIGTRNVVRVFITNNLRRRIVVEVFDSAPHPSVVSGLPGELRVERESVGEFRYHIEPLSRGKREFAEVYLRLKTRLGLWDLTIVRPLTQMVHVYPNVRAISEMTLLIRKNHVSQAGVHLARLKGRGSDFDRLRDYQRDDELRSVDWKATARHEQLITREYVVERDQNIMLVLDCGRSMLNEHDGITHFDRVLNAAILLTDIACRQGDSVGLIAGGREIECWIPPMRGPNSAKRLVQQIYDLPARQQVTDYNQLADQLRIRHRKRSLVVLLTHALDEIHFAEISAGMQRLKQSHLVLAAFLQNSDLNTRAEQIPNSTVDAFQIAAAVELEHQQSTAIELLSRQGFLTTHCPPEELFTELVSQYLNVKAKHLL